MNILLVHNRYRQAGGEDQVFDAESRLLEEHGHAVYRFETHNDDVAQYGSLELARRTVWNGESFRAVREVVQQFRPQVMHVHNTFPLLSPAIYYAAKEEGVPVVQTLHNYRLLCPAATFFRDGRICEDCLGKTVPWPGVRHACYRDSRPASAVVATYLTYHRQRRTWHRMIDAYIVLTEFCRQKFSEGGLPPDKLLVKPNFVASDPGTGLGRGDYLLFVGRLSPEKGLETLLKAWEKLGRHEPKLKIVGDGPLRSSVANFAAVHDGVEWLGRQPTEAVQALMREAKFLIAPSAWYETFGLVAAEAFACGTPAVVPSYGALAEIVEDGVTGYHFAGTVDDLAAKLTRCLGHADLEPMRKRARASYEARYTAEQNYLQLMAIYEQVLGSAGG